MPGASAVFYMGLTRLDHIVTQMLEHGAPATRPAGIVAQATSSDQRVITGTLATIRSVAAAANLPAPALLIVGDVVALHGSLAWFNAATAELSQTA
jgi:uroporphyrin-III C-methyltransferase/precorrin-2 dehydrogenase/sirohydrochlorin ferrochelatase